MAMLVRMKLASVLLLQVICQTEVENTCESDECSTKGVVALQVWGSRKRRQSWPPCSTLVPQKHVLFMSGGQTPFSFFEMAGSTKPDEDDKPAGHETSTAFDKIYESEKVWGGDGEGYSFSGAGSSIERTESLCQVFIATVAKVLGEKDKHGEELSVRVLDAPSGDWFWMPSCLGRIDAMLPPSASVHYQGVDVAEKAIRMSEKKREHDDVGKHIHVAPFQRVDLVSFDDLQSVGKGFDIVLCHDALQHNPISQVISILKNFNKLANYLVVDVDTADKNDADIPVGSFRPLDLTKAPFNYRPLCADENKYENSGYVREVEGEWFAVFELPIEL